MPAIAPFGGRAGVALLAAIAADAIASCGAASNFARVYLSGQEHWQTLADQGVLNGEYIDWLNCKGSDWDQFRSLYVAHIENGRWNWADEPAWVMEPEHWHLAKAAEALLEKWRTADLKVHEGSYNATSPEEKAGYRRAPAKSAVSVMDTTAFASIVLSHLERVARPENWRPSDFGSTCLPGLVAAITVFARSLAVLGSGVETDEANDGFLLWRIEMGYLLSGLMFGEGALVFDLTSAPGWPSVSARLIEGMLRLHRPATPAGAPEPLPVAILGSPRPLLSPLPPRFPPDVRHQRATDPLGSTPWGQRATTWMTYRDQVLRAAFAARIRPPWEGLGPPWAPALHAKLRAAGPESPKRRPRSGRIRVLGWISQHGALDLEMPSLLEALFPEMVEVRYVLIAERPDVICKKTEGSAVMDVLCAEAIALGRGTPAGADDAAAAAAADVGSAPWLRAAEGPLLRAFADGTATSSSPDIIATCGWEEAIWVRQTLPDSRVVLFFGPPVMLHVGVDVREGRHEKVARYWRDVDNLLGCVAGGHCLIAAESLFRSEQFLYQAGSEVPFLRPMSTWVNASYAPQSHGGRSRVLVHTRGRLKYETHFVEMLQRVAGPAFQHDIVAQEGRIIPFRELATFNAVVILPWSPELCMLRHLFKMAVPLFVPHKSLLRNMVHISNQRLMPYPYNTPSPHSDRKSVEEVHKYDPFLDTIRWPADVKGMEARMYWAEYSEYLLLPLLQGFLGSADLIAKLHVTDGRKISAQMRSAYRQDMEEMRGFWSETLSRLLDMPVP